MFINTPSMLFDSEFLKKLDTYPQREVYAKIISLTFDERPITEITGKLTAGSISVDGSSAVRRTCNLTMVTDEVNINELDWALKTKFTVMIGLKNFIDNIHPNIIWFPQGIFIINNFSQSLNLQGYQIQISGKDKMCLLDGSIGGALFATHDFGKLDVYDSAGGVTYIHEIPIYQIIRNAIRTYAQEPWHNIVINDLDNTAVELIQYKLDDRKLYILETSMYSNFSTYGSQMVFGNTDESINYKLEKAIIEKIENEDGEIIEKTVMETIVRDGDIYYLSEYDRYVKVVKVVAYGDTAGYRSTDLTYAGELIIDAGQSITSMLDKIVQQLGEYEYFYDLQGRFVFQRKKIYFNRSWTNAVTNDIGDTFYENSAAVSQYSYEFMRGNIVESFNNKPNITNIRNDWSIWGVMKGVSGIDIPIHLRYAIDEMPTSYRSIRSGILFASSNSIVATEPTAQLVDWRELIYQMAWDNAKYQSHIEELTYALYNGYVHYDINKINTADYKQYYRYDFTHKTMRIIKTMEELESEIKKENFIFGFNQSLKVSKTIEQEMAEWESTWDTGYDAYYADMLAFWREIYNPDKDSDAYKIIEKDTNGEEIEKFDAEKWQEWNANYGWNPFLVHCTAKPSSVTFTGENTLKFWLDFISVDSDLGKYRVSIIGRRPKVVNDSDVKAIFYRETPNVLFIDPANDEPRDNDLNYVKMNLVGGLSNYFTVSTQGKSAKEAMDNLVYQTTYYQEAITLNCLPVYHLSPNTKIKVEDDRTGIRGEYLVKSFNYSLAHDGMMSITATRAVDRLI